MKDFGDAGTRIPARGRQPIRWRDDRLGRTYTRQSTFLATWRQLKSWPAPTPCRGCREPYVRAWFVGSAHLSCFLRYRLSPTALLGNRDYFDRLFLARSSHTHSRIPMRQCNVRTVFGDARGCLKNQQAGFLWQRLERLVVQVN